MDTITLYKLTSGLTQDVGIHNTGGTRLGFLEKSVVFVFTFL